MYLEIAMDFKVNELKLEKNNCTVTKISPNSLFVHYNWKIGTFQCGKQVVIPIESSKLPSYFFEQ